MFTARIQYFSENINGRDFAVGDIHGYFSELQNALNEVNFNPEFDRLFTMGDLVDRGPESHMVIDWLNKPWFHSTYGNHEQMVCHTILKDPNVPGDGEEWLFDIGLSEQTRIARRLEQLPLIIEVDTKGGPIGLMHSDCPFDDWTDLKSVDWERLDEEDRLVQACIWSYERFRVKYNGIVKNIRAVFHGHVTLPKVAKLGNVFYIDTKGGVEGGALTLVNLKELNGLWLV